MFTAHNMQVNTHVHTHLNSQTETQILTPPPLLCLSLDASLPGEEMKARHSARMAGRNEDVSDILSDQ